MARTKKYNADPKQIQKAIDLIGNGFDWLSTPQGIDYWEQVQRNLEALLDEVSPQKATG
jgi:hypothetical protein